MTTLDCRILVVVPFAMDDDELQRRREQEAKAQLAAGTTLEYRPVATGPRRLVSAQDLALADVAILQAGAGAANEGYDAVCVDTVSDSGTAALRSVLDIPVVPAGASMFAFAATLGHRFGILAMWDRWKVLYDKVLTESGLAHSCAGMRSIGRTPDTRALLNPSEEYLELLVGAARTLVEVDRAEVICLGSTTMHTAADLLRDELDVPVIDPGPLSYRLAETHVLLGLSQSRASHPAPLELERDLLDAMVDGAAHTVRGRT